MRLTHLVILGFLGLSTASVINSQARSSSVTVAMSTLNHTTSESASLQTSTPPSDSPVISHLGSSSPSPPHTPITNNAVIVNVDMTDFDEEDQNENTQHHGGHGGGHGGHGRGHSTSGHTGTSSSSDGSNGGSSGTRGGGAAVAAGGSASGKKSDGARLKPEVIGVTGMVMMGMGGLMG